VNTLVLRVKTAEYFVEISECTVRTQQRVSGENRITRCKKSRFYPVLANIRIKKSSLSGFFKEKR